MQWVQSKINRSYNFSRSVKMHHYSFVLTSIAFNWHTESRFSCLYASPDSFIFSLFVVKLRCSNQCCDLLYCLCVTMPLCFTCIWCFLHQNSSKSLSRLYFWSRPYYFFVLSLSLCLNYNKSTLIKVIICIYITWQHAIEVN